jgi:intracellular sulfur oxidation DsrE/DsrF family protein
MIPFDPSTSPRRSFLGRMAGGAAALLAGGAGVAAAEPLVPSPVTLDDEWLSKLHGQYRQYFDATDHNDVFPLYYAFNWAKTMKDTYKASNADVCAIIGLRHMGIAPAFKDNIWQKYKLGVFFKINDPKTKAPSVRNFMNSEAAGDLMFPGSSIGEQVKNGAVVTVCNLATTVLSGMAAQAAGLSVKAEDAYKEWAANLLPGAYLVPSGVLAVHRAQKAGSATYCYAG